MNDNNLDDYTFPEMIRILFLKCRARSSDSLDTNMVIKKKIIIIIRIIIIPHRVDGRIACLRFYKISDFRDQTVYVTAKSEYTMNLKYFWEQNDVYVLAVSVQVRPIDVGNLR